MISDKIRLLFALFATLCVVHAQQRPFDDGSTIESHNSVDFRSNSIEIHQTGSFGAHAGYVGATGSAMTVTDDSGITQGYVFSKVSSEQASAGKNYEQLLASLSYKIEINDDLEMAD